MTWLEHFMSVTEDAESPRSYFYWSGLAAISAVLKNNVYLDKHFYKLYPNIYVMLIGKSGLRKGVPVALAKNLVTKVNNTRVISGRNSIQGVVRDLSTAYATPNGKVVDDSSGFLISSEFASFLVADPVALTILTDLYDGHYNAEWKNTLKSGQETLKKVNLTMLGASNQTHFQESVPGNAVGGGFIARTFLIVEEKKAKINALVRPPETTMNLEPLIDYLKDVSKLSGGFTYGEGAGELYEDWYTTFSKKIHNDKTGSAERLHDHVLKIAMLISVSRKLDKVIETEDMEEAINACLTLTSGVDKATLGHGKSEYASKTALVLQELLAAPEYTMTRRRILTKCWGDIDAIDLNRVVDTLEQAHAITQRRNGEQIYYSLTPECVDQYMSYKKHDKSVN